MITATKTQPSVWDDPDTRRGQRQHPARATFPLCSAAPPATPLGLCAECLSAAVAEHALITPVSGRRPDSVQVAILAAAAGPAGTPGRRATRERQQPPAVRRGDRRALAGALNGTLGLELADFEEAREFLRSPEGSEMLDAWLASHPDGTGDDGERNA